MKKGIQYSDCIWLQLSTSVSVWTWQLHSQWEISG